MTISILDGAGHHLPVEKGWLDFVAQWVTNDAAAANGITGAEPNSTLGLATLPRTVWLGHPVLHLLLSSAAWERDPDPVVRGPGARAACSQVAPFAGHILRPPGRGQVAVKGGDR